MNHLESELDQLRVDLSDMISLVQRQLEKSKNAIIEGDIDFAEEIVVTDRRVNGMELKIDRDCENILALYQPVAVDLRLVLAALKSNHELERIGDNAEGIARFILDVNGQLDEELLKKFKIPQMFDTAIVMMCYVAEAFVNEDTAIARKVFNKDKFLNENYKNSSTLAVELLKEGKNLEQQILFIVTILSKLERIGDLAKNLSEEIIFYIEAKVIKHMKKKK